MDKVASIDDLIAAVAGAKTVSFGGGGVVRKPMAAACALARSDIAPVQVNAFLGGPDVDVLIAYGKVQQLHFAFMGLGPLGLLPNFRAARERGDLQVIESSEYLIIAALEAAASGVPFLPTRSGLGTDVLNWPNTPYRVMECPITGEPLVAVPAADIDVAVLHANVADRRGNLLIFGDPFIDGLLCRAAKQVWVTAEAIVDALPAMDARPASTFVSRVWTHGVVKAPHGAGSSGCYPDYRCDLKALAEYKDRSLDRSWLDKFTATGSEPLRHGNG